MHFMKEHRKISQVNQYNTKIFILWGNTLIHKYTDLFDFKQNKMG